MIMFLLYGFFSLSLLVSIRYVQRIKCATLGYPIPSPTFNYHLLLLGYVIIVGNLLNYLVNNAKCIPHQPYHVHL